MKKEKIKEYGYLQFPLCLIKETYKDIENGLNLMISYGIVNYALKLDYDMTDVAKQLLYYYARKRNVLQSALVKRLSRLAEEELYFEDRNPGFDAKGNFDPDTDLQIKPLLKLFESDPELMRGAILNYQLHLATSDNHLGITIGTNDSTLKRYNQATKIKQDFEFKYGPDAMPCCKKSMLFDFRDKHQKDIDTFRAYIGIISLIGQRNFISTTKPVILSRMIGAKCKEAYTHFSDDPIIKKTVDKYKTRYWMDKLLFTLAQRKFIMYLTEKHKRLVYVSKYMEPKELADHIKERRDMRDLKQLQKEALQHLYNTAS